MEVLGIELRQGSRKVRLGRPIVEIIQQQIHRTDIPRPQLAKMVDCNRSTLHRYLTEESEVGSELASRLLAVFDIVPV